MKTKLFSSDGIDFSHARREPDSVYFPDENTHEEIKFLFVTLRSTQHGEGISEGAVDIKNLPYFADLSALASDAQGNLLSVDDVRLPVLMFTKPCFHHRSSITLSRLSMGCAVWRLTLSPATNLYSHA